MKKPASTRLPEPQRTEPLRRSCRPDGTDCIRLCFGDAVGKTYVTYRDHEVTAMKAAVEAMHREGAVLFSATRGQWIY